MANIAESGKLLLQNLRRKAGDAVLVKAPWVKRPDKVNFVPTSSSIRITPERIAGGFNIQKIVFSEDGIHQLEAVDLSDTEISLSVSTEKGRALSSGETFGMYGLFPLGQVKGASILGDPMHMAYLTYVNNGIHSFGTKEIVNRFDDTKIAENDAFSGGIAFSAKAGMSIENQTGLKEKTKDKIPVAQMVYTFTNENFEDLTRLLWHHRKPEQEEIGISVDSWAWFLEFEKKKFFICVNAKTSGKRDFSFSTIKQINDTLSGGLPWKAALAEFGPRSGYVIRKDRTDLWSNYPVTKMLNSSPVQCVARKRSRS